MSCHCLTHCPLGGVHSKEYSEDTVVKGSKDKFTELIKNSYKVLLTRGLKGCYVCFMDKDTERFVRSRMENPNRDCLLYAGQKGLQLQVSGSHHDGCRLGADRRHDKYNRR
ncbi:MULTISPECIES: DNA/RNA helicase domain-containing protein [unclassified Methanothrix]|jgi:hypothetical protein|uniref:DNA/RNA helicase domain-containing protein n=1 Tax=unclassified Methanothrix TaxID=2620051 RepID=UPI0031831223